MEVVPYGNGFEVQFNGIALSCYHDVCLTRKNLTFDSALADSEQTTDFERIRQIVLVQDFVQSIKRGQEDRVVGACVIHLWGSQGQIATKSARRDRCICL
jgi:hypothetical protein